ncbi:MAG TPA: DAK2 domain-containing protein [Anaerolineaceae bacterium]|nr:DAK2 domain-containing protein [Anaerolineaceae bacterium]
MLKQNTDLDSHTMTGILETQKTINGNQFKILFEASLRWLKANQQYVNSLNVFPVPDGDTGTNMLLTMQAAYNEISTLEEENIGKMAKNAAQGALMGARGNSGVILSQILRGFARVLDNLPEMDAQLFSNALAESRNTAYKGVVRPVEGTILTVIKDISIAVENASKKTSNLLAILEEAVKAADESVKFTPELLPILKTAGVVDSGGKGLFILLEGIQRYLNGLPLDESAVVIKDFSAIKFAETIEDIEDGQDVEVVIDFTPYQALDLKAFYDDLSLIGTSIQVGEGDGLYRMHIHTEAQKQDEPEALIKTLGEISKIYKEDLAEQMRRIEAKKNEITFNDFVSGSIAVVAVSPGIGLSQIFASQGACAIIEGGQTMNPSIQEILKSFEDLPTDKVIILPNNKNIILAANSAKPLSVKQVEVIPTRNIPQGISAILRWNPDGDFQQVVDDMNDALDEADCGEITIATRNVNLNGVEVQKGKTIGLLNGKLVVAGDSVSETCLNLLEKYNLEERERVTFFYGTDLTEQEANRIADIVQQKYPNHEIELHSGGQPHYPLIMSLE